MPDVLKIAQDRRAALLKEVAALDRFIQMAHKLLTEHGGPESSTKAANQTSGKLTPTPAARPSTEKAQTGSQTEAFLKAHDVKVERPKSVAAQPLQRNIANLA